jgi:hypothetical protein
MHPWTLLALSLCVSVANAATDPVASMSGAVEQCQLKQAARGSRVRALPDGSGYIKTQELEATYSLDLSRATAPNEATLAVVEVATSLVSARAVTEDAVQLVQLSVTGPEVTKFVRRYKFEWDGVRWLLVEAYLNLNIRMPGVQSLPMRDKKMDTANARLGSDAGASCVQLIESL